MQPVLQQKVRLNFSANNLKSKDVLSASDPLLRLYEKLPSGAKGSCFFATDAIKNNNNPKWVNSVEVLYHFEINQVFIMEVFDHDSNSDNDLVCRGEFTLGNLMASAGCQQRVMMYKPGKTKPSKKQSVTVCGTAVVQSKLYANIDLRAKLNKSSVFANLDKDDTFFELNLQKPDGTEVCVYRSSVYMDSQKPNWSMCTVSLGDLVSGNPMNTFTLRIMRQKSNGQAEFMGENKKLVPHHLVVLPGQPEKKVDVFNSKDKDVGDVFIERFEIFEKHGFLDYLAGGLDFHLTVAVDYTGSNGAQTSPSSLHYIDPTGQKRNQYIDALRSIGNVLAAYCQKPYIPALGFGGFVSIDGAQPVTSHCFPMSMSTAHPYFAGIEGVVQGYSHSLQHIQLSGPTYFAPVIQSALVSASRPFTPDYQHFNILLLIADGIVNDMDATVDAIVQSSDKPMCVIIVGVGSADFREMNTLDGDDRCLRSKKFGNSKNDIVQFVEMSKYIHDPAKLAEATLKEVPACVERFMTMHKIVPIVRQPVPVVVAPAAAPAPAQ